MNASHALECKDTREEKDSEAKGHRSCFGNGALGQMLSFRVLADYGENSYFFFDS